MLANAPVDAKKCQGSVGRVRARFIGSALGKLLRQTRHESLAAGDLLCLDELVRLVGLLDMAGGRR